MKKLLLFIFAYLPFAISAQQTANSYKIINTRDGGQISTDELVRQIGNVDVLVFGEEHNDSIGHTLEAEIFNKMLEAYPSTALSMEMFSTDVQLVVDEYLASLITEKNFMKDSRAWNNYKDYRPLVELARSRKTALIAANVTTRYSNVVSMKGLESLTNFPKSSRTYLPPLPIDTATGRYHEKFIATLGGHNMGGMKIYQTQNLWDASMAWSIHRYAAKHPGKKIFQVNGRFHSDEKLGLIAQLAKYAPKLKVMNISCFDESNADAADTTKFGQLADFIIITKKLKDAIN